MLIGHSISDAEGRIMAVDHGVCELFQRSETELIGLSYTDITHPDDVSWNVALVDKLEARGGPLTIRKRYLRPAALAVWCDVQVSRLSAGSEAGRLVGTINGVDPRTVCQTPERLWRSACRIDTALRHRRSELGEDLFGDYAWLVLLQLYKTEAEGNCVDLTELNDLTAIRPQPLTRWLKVLEERGLIDRYEEQRCVGQLTAAGIAKVERLLDGTAAT
jgi:hypothetical protein